MEESEGGRRERWKGGEKRGERERWREEEWCGEMEGGDSEAHSPGLVVAHFHPFRLFVVVVAVFGAGLSFASAVSLFVAGGLMSVGCRQLWVIDVWAGCCFVVVSSCFVMLLSRCTIHMVATSPCWRCGPCIWV